MSISITRSDLLPIFLLVNVIDWRHHSFLNIISHYLESCSSPLLVMRSIYTVKCYFPEKKISVTDVFFVFLNFQWLLSTFSRGAIIIAGPTNLCVVENQWPTSMREWFLLLTVSTLKCHDSKKSLLLELDTIWGSEHLLDWCNQLTQGVVWLPLLLIRPVSWLVLS